VTETLLGPLPDTVITALSWATSWLFLLCIAPLLWSLHYPYRHPKRAHAKPVMWGTWFIVGSMATVGQALGGAPPQSWWAKGALSLGPIIVAVVAVLRHEPLVITRVDRWSLWMCLLGIVIYIPLYFGWLGSPVPYRAGEFVVVVAMLVDTVAAAGMLYGAWRGREPVTQIVTFALALGGVLTVLCILPVPWTFLSAGTLCFLAAQQVLIIGALAGGRARHPRETSATAAAAAS
jgi:hypothetical protein